MLRWPVNFRVFHWLCSAIYLSICGTQRQVTPNIPYGSNQSLNKDHLFPGIPSKFDNVKQQYSSTKWAENLRYLYASRSDMQPWHKMVCTGVVWSGHWGIWSLVDCTSWLLHRSNGCIFNGFLWWCQEFPQLKVTICHEVTFKRAKQNLSLLIETGTIMWRKCMITQMIQFGHFTAFDINP